MKKIISCIISFLLILSVTVSILAEGDPNIDSGGGGMGQGTSENKWSPGRDGVRVTIVRASDYQSVSTPIDFTNNPPTDIEVHFGRKNKIQYRSGAALTSNTGTYTCVQPNQSMPTIVNDSGGNNIDAIKQHFCDRSTLEFIASQTGFNYDVLINGEYKILLEPLVYLKYEGIMYAMTATEAALFDQKLSGGIRSKFVDLSHKNLPLSMFLEYNDLGFAAWSGSTTSRVSNENIIQTLGLGIIRFTEPVIDPQESEIQYRVDTEVITAVSLSTDEEKTPEDPAFAYFSINGQTYSHEDIYIPAGSSQLAWVKWRTPTEPGTVTISIFSNCTLDTNQIVAEIIDLNENIPPDPQANDRNDGYSMPAAPGEPSVTTLTWGEWDCWWHEYWVWIHNWYECKHDGWSHWLDLGWWEDHGWYEYEWLPYTATLSAEMSINPDEKSPTATATTMKSGYGFNMEVSAEIVSDSPNSHITGAQNVVSYFPEFNYETYWRLLERVNVGYSSSFEFQKNKYSTYYRPVHFTPIWFPDGQYTAYAEILDAWTPAGMLQINQTAGLTINDNLFSDWHVRPVN